MHFYYVDHISSLGDNIVTGSKTFSEHEPMQYDGVIAPGVVSEAIGQLASWLALKKNQFTGRPVFLFADGITINRYAKPQDVVELRATIHGMDEETLVFSGEALLDGQVIQKIDNCSCYFMSLDQLEQREIVAERFDKLIDKGIYDNNPLDKKFFIEELIGHITESVPDQMISAMIKVPKESWFFKDHFPKFPVTPIVVINEIIGHLAGQLYPAAKKLKVSRVSEIKIKNFIQPDEICQFKLTLLPSETPNTIATEAIVLKNKKPVMRGRYEFIIAESLA
jgi:3-hydroxymyristoyl/3-hydroxydecanoyl-(acyl carrier protein) dehydratase